MNITWRKTEYYEHTGQSEDQEYILTVRMGFITGKWFWKVYGGSGEYKILSSSDKLKSHFKRASTAKKKATEALQNYLK